MVTSKKKDSPKTPEKQGSEESAPEPNKISASTPYDFNGKNLTPYGGLLPVITMREKLVFWVRSSAPSPASLLGQAI